MVERLIVDFVDFLFAFFARVRSRSLGMFCIASNVGLGRRVQMVQGKLLSFSLRIFSLWVSFLVNFIILGEYGDDFFVSQV